MTSEDNVYRELQEYLDRETMGFPATATGSDIKVLKLLFTPEQAKATMCLTRRPEPVDRIYERAKKEEFTTEELENTLYETAGRGLVYLQNVNGIRHFKNMPYIVGFYETQVFALTPEFGAAHDAYMMDGGYAFSGRKVSIMRTIPVEQSIRPEHNVSSYDDIKTLVDQSDGPVVVFECVCRKHRAMDGDPCQMTTRKASCLAFGPFAETMAEFNKGKTISKQEAIEILRANGKDGLIFQPSNTQYAEYICSCCGCCCGHLSWHKSEYIPHAPDREASSYVAEVDPEACSGCQTCVNTCQVEAMVFNEDDMAAVVDLNRCIGCGVCIPVCPVEAIALLEKEPKVVPPKDHAEQQEILTTGK